MILVTGGGFIGQAISDRLGSESLLLRRSPKGADIVYDLSDTDAVRGLIQTLQDKHVTHIVHTAAVTPWSESPNYMQDIAMAKTLSIVCNELHINSLIYMSGWNVYDMSKSQPPYGEATPTQPSTDYGASKLAVEQYLKENLETTVLVNVRLASVYGPGQVSTGLIPNLVKAALHDGAMICNSTSTRRDYLYIDDLVSAVEKICSTERTASSDINIGSGTTVSVAECAQLVKDTCFELTGKKVDIVMSQDVKESELLNNQLAINKAQSMGLLDQQTPFETGIREYVQWCLSQ